MLFSRQMLFSNSLYYTEILKSLSASLRLVFLLYFFLLPIIKAQGMEYSPHLNFFLYVPGITTDLRNFNFILNFFISRNINYFCEFVSTIPAPNTTSSITLTPSTTMHLEPMKQLSSIITGLD